MPYALIIAGVILTVAGVRNTEGTLFSLLKNDFTGNNSFIWWFLAILGIGAVGYIPDIRKLANAFLALVLIVMVLANRGIFNQFVTAIRSPIPKAPEQKQASSSSGGSSDILSQVASNPAALSALASVA